MMGTDLCKAAAPEAPDEGASARMVRAREAGDHHVSTCVRTKVATGGATQGPKSGDEDSVQIRN